MKIMKIFSYKKGISVKLLAGSRAGLETVDKYCQLFENWITDKICYVQLLFSTLQSVL